MEYRNYENVNNDVKETYKKARINQTLKFNEYIREVYDNRNKSLININDALDLLNEL